MSDAEDSSISTSLGQSNLTIGSFTMQGGSTADLFVCVVRTSVGGVVSEAIGLIEAANGTDVPGTMRCVCVRVLFIDVGEEGQVRYA